MLKEKDLSHEIKLRIESLRAKVSNLFDEDTKIKINSVSYQKGQRDRFIFVVFLIGCEWRPGKQINLCFDINAGDKCYLMLRGEWTWEDIFIDESANLSFATAIEYDEFTEREAGMIFEDLFYKAI